MKYKIMDVVNIGDVDGMIFDIKDGIYEVIVITNLGTFTYDTLLVNKEDIDSEPDALSEEGIIYDTLRVLLEHLKLREGSL